jgi:hypothetical protein
VLIQIIFNCLIYLALLWSAPRTNVRWRTPDCPETDVSTPLRRRAGHSPRKCASPSIGTARADENGKGRTIMAKLEFAAFTFIALFAGLLTVATVTPIA